MHGRKSAERGRHKHRGKTDNGLKNIPNLGTISGVVRGTRLGEQNETQTGTWIIALAVTLNYFLGPE